MDNCVKDTLHRSLKKEGQESARECIEIWGKEARKETYVLAVVWLLSLYTRVLSMSFV